ncbi:hypothetical protein Phi18:3_gp028 [Cellulophaga phage phi18:3]|uniref:Uncharacterized protein n=1 Tax=Cellulophaga phage phi18:3 TaxID=1327983 RepID=S0A185_9CAUD|nr:hypothetical protein Phi18:3_gp028 [Cellulophaga phage phi18:3]AGO48540.1 hypothetical protein Phi18:3_gp028 [Cellulophaga phage phi18:3]
MLFNGCSNFIGPMTSSTASTALTSLAPCPELEYVF